MVADKVNMSTLSEILKNEEDIKKSKTDLKTDLIDSYNLDQHNKSVYLSAYRINCCFNWYKLILKYRDSFDIDLNNLVAENKNNASSEASFEKVSAEPIKKTNKIKTKSKISVKDNSDKYESI